MIHFIEATHNMFLIQQKRVDELETKVESLTGNNGNIISKKDDDDDSYVYDVKQNYTQTRKLYKEAVEQEGASGGEEDDDDD